MGRLRVATVWLTGCSGCHMSFLDLDEWLLDLAQLVDIVYSPVADVKEFPENVDLTLVEGCVANEDNLEMIRRVRERSKFVVAFGDCAVTGNVPAFRNTLGGANIVLERAFADGANLNPQIPEMEGIVPKLLDRVMPLHEVVNIDAYLPGCPPPSKRIRAVLETLVAGDPLVLEGREMIKFG